MQYLQCKVPPGPIQMCLNCLRTASWTLPPNPTPTDTLPYSADLGTMPGTYSCTHPVFHTC